jgi:hypothetical protein
MRSETARSLTPFFGGLPPLEVLPDGGKTFVAVSAKSDDIL